MSAAAQPSNSGIVTDDQGQRHIPESTRADGSTRKAIKIRPGYRPPEDVELYKNRTAEAFRNRGKGGGIPGAEGLKDDNKTDHPPAASAASNKNAKRREARKKAKAAESQKESAGGATVTTPAEGTNSETKPPASEEANPELEKEKKVRALKKKLKQARDLKEKKEGGEPLLPEQIAKVIKISELIRELQALGFDADSEPNKDEKEKPGGGAP